MAKSNFEKVESVVGWVGSAFSFLGQQKDCIITAAFSFYLR